MQGRDAALRRTRAARGHSTNASDGGSTRRPYHSMKRAVVLLSGGLDSATTLALCHREGFEPCALSFDYGQRHNIELLAAKRVAASLGVREHRIAQIDLRVFGGSALTDEIPVPKNRDEGKTSDIPVTYVPARNTIFLSYALAWCEVLGASDIFIGANAVDYSGYPDCRPAFISAFEELATWRRKPASEGTRFHIHAPLLSMSKAADHRKRHRTRRGLFPDAQLLRSDRGLARLRRMRFMPDQAGRLPCSRAAGSNCLRDKMKRLFAMFVLTPGEQRVVIFVVLALLAWTWLKHQQEVKRETSTVRSVHASPNEP